MNYLELTRTPQAFDAIARDTEAFGFTMVSEPKVGAVLAALAASKPGGRLLELETGTGHGTAWLVSKRHLDGDARVTFHIVDGAEFIQRASRGQFDLIYADAWPGKFIHLDETLALLRPGGMYVIDDLLPQPNWPDGHAPKVPALIQRYRAAL